MIDLLMIFGGSVWDVIGGWGVAAIGALMALWVSYRAGKMKAKDQAALRDMKAYRETRKAIDDVESDDDLARVRDRLRERGKSGGDL
ncbi:MAG: hypothetical protein ACRC0L_10700 [Angustibacter sp.]